MRLERRFVHARALLLHNNDFPEKEPLVNYLMAHIIAIVAGKLRAIPDVQIVIKMKVFSLLLSRPL